MVSAPPIGTAGPPVQRGPDGGTAVVALLAATRHWAVLQPGLGQ